MGDIGLTLGPIGFGGFKIGRNEGIKYPEGYALPDERAVDGLLNSVLDLGIRYIDTAPAYGLSEERIGRAVGHRRGEYTLSTKVGETFADGQSRYDYSAEAVRASVERSLRRLKTDVLDLAFVHAHRDDQAVLNETDVVPALQSLRDRGLVRWIGFSGHTMEAFRAALGWADAVMVEYHLEYRALEAVMAEASDGGVCVVVKKGLASGRLSAGEAVQFVLSNTDVSSLVIGGLRVEHFRDNVRAACEVRGD